MEDSRLIVLTELDPSPIQKAEFFSNLLEKDLEFVVSRSSILQLRRGGELFHPGQKADRFYMLIGGEIRVFKPRSDGGETETARFMPGTDLIGDFDFAREAEYDEYAEAVEDSVLIMFPAYGITIDSLALENPHTYSKILISSIKIMTGRIKSTQQNIVEKSSSFQEDHRRAYEDPGTGLWKQTYLTDEINRILENPMALIMLKPDRFKSLVDSRGHGAGDEAMVLIAAVLRKITRRIGRGWPLRFKSNETGILINKCTAPQAEKIARELHKAIAALPVVPARGGVPAFSFSGTVAYSVWPDDDAVWDNLFQGTYDLLLNTWRAEGNTVTVYKKGGS
ncbi:MAG: diguanylate cyclase [Treponema sp.]|jgi:diguanylate cyclase (GGDEF)-like protein|nr:diguanylate cyclase [Treponema sp.]